MTDRGRCAEAAEAAVAAFGRLHVLCNNAGIAGGGAVADPGFADWDRAMAVNLGGAVNVVKTFVPADPRTRQRGAHRQHIVDRRHHRAAVRGRCVHDGEVRGARSQRITAAQPGAGGNRRVGAVPRADQHPNSGRTRTRGSGRKADGQRRRSGGTVQHDGRGDGSHRGRVVPSCAASARTFRTSCRTVSSATRSSRCSTRSSKHSRPIRRFPRRVLRSNADAASCATVCATCR